MEALGLLVAATPALPLDEAGKYVAGAYVVFVVLLVVYVAIMAMKLSRIEKELREVADYAERRGRVDSPTETALVHDDSTPASAEAGVK